MGVLYVHLLWVFLTLAHIMLDCLDQSSTHSSDGRKWISVDVTPHIHLKKVIPFNCGVQPINRGQLYKCAFDFSCVILPDL